MSFGFGVGDVVALTQQLTETYQRVKEIGDIDGRLNEVGVAVLELAAAFRTLPDLDIASLEDSEREELGEITQATIKSINAINPILDCCRQGALLA
jgi:hypothetical protein